VSHATAAHQKLLPHLPLPTWLQCQDSFPSKNKFTLNGRFALVSAMFNVPYPLQTSPWRWGNRTKATYQHFSTLNAPPAQHLTRLPHYPISLTLKPQIPSLFIITAVLRPFGAPKPWTSASAAGAAISKPREKTMQINVQFGLAMWDADPCGDNIPEWIQ
jgi:hypothetical protein